MAKIRLHSHKKVKEIEYNTSKSLLQALQENNVDIFAPCGGNGTCGKCRIRVKGHGVVTSCLFFADTDLDVVLPDKRESRILTEQYQYNLKLPATTGELLDKASNPLGLAIDIGTTSIVFYWISLTNNGILNTTSRTNPQAKYGADVISRINHCSTENGLQNLQKVIIDAINSEIEDFEKHEGIEKENILKVSVSANTTMLHLLLGVDPTSIALAPFVPQFTEAKTLQAKELNINIGENAKIHLLPSISAYVGADITSGIASLSPPSDVKNFLFIDIGTNGEMALVTPEKVYCCATAAGPAFEGANIKHGMGALDGAIFSYDSNGYETISDDKPVGICGSGLIDIVAYLLDNKIIETEGELKKDFVLATEEESGNGEEITITAQDIREVQLAKSAIITGIKIMIQEAKLTYEDIDALYLAGGFGNYLVPENALKIGLIPVELNSKIIPVGNTSGAGAVLHVLSDHFVPYLEEVIEKSEHIELANHEEFEMEFAMNMYFQV